MKNKTRKSFNYYFWFTQLVSTRLSDKNYNLLGTFSSFGSYFWWENLFGKFHSFRDNDLFSIKNKIFLFDRLRTFIGFKFTCHRFIWFTRSTETLVSVQNNDQSSFSSTSRNPNFFPTLRTQSYLVAVTHMPINLKFVVFIYYFYQLGSILLLFLWTIYF